MLYYRHESIHTPSVTLERSTVEKDFYHGIVSFVPDLNPASTDDCWKSIWNKDMVNNGSKMPSKRMEFLFLIDCTSSMMTDDAFK